jgi:acyl dehydratase
MRSHLLQPACRRLFQYNGRRLLKSGLYIDLQPPLRVTGTIRPGGAGVEVGQYAQVERVFTESEVDAFGCIVSDRNPLHQSWAKDDDATPAIVSNHMLTRWVVADTSSGQVVKSKVLVHGMLVSSLFTCILGTLIPGCVYLSQTLEFRRPVYANDAVVGRIAVLTVEPWTKRPGVRLTCDTTVHSVETNKVCVRGQAHVFLPASDDATTATTSAASTSQQ